jgi:hypothetical protein
MLASDRMKRLLVSTSTNRAHRAPGRTPASDGGFGMLREPADVASSRSFSF